MLFLLAVLSFPIVTIFCIPSLLLSYIIPYNHISYGIYRVRDLLNPSQDNMKLREVQGEGFMIQDLTEVYCGDRDSVMQAIQLGKY